MVLGKVRGRAFAPRLLGRSFTSNSSRSYSRSQVHTRYLWPRWRGRPRGKSSNFELNARTRDREGNVSVEEPLRSSLRRRINPLVIFLLHAVTDFGFIPLLHPSVNEYEMPTVIPASIQAESLLNVRDTSGHCFQRSERYPILRTDYKCLIKRRQTNFMFQRKRSGKKKREEEDTMLLITVLLPGPR